MPWCPQCDETFPEGPSCPRCNTPLVEGIDPGKGAEIGARGNLPQLEVPRRLRRAFDRMDGPPRPPRHLMGFTIFLLVFAGGLLLGRMGGVPSDGPSLQRAPAPLQVTGGGSLSYVARMPSARSDTALVRHDLVGGGIDVVTRFTLPFVGRGRERTALRSLEGSVAFVVDEEGVGGGIGAVPHDGSPLLWLDGIDAGWESSDVLLVLAEDHLTRWTFAERRSVTEVAGPWIDMFQTRQGLVLEGIRGDERFLAVSTPKGVRETIGIPSDARVLAVDGEGKQAVVDTSDGIGFWDGTTFEPFRNVDGYRAIAGSMSPDASQATVTLARRDSSGEVLLGIAGPDGGVAFHPVTRSAERGCAPEPVWEAAGAWVYVAPGDGTLRAVEVDGGRDTSAATGIVDCGIAWTG